MPASEFSSHVMVTSTSPTYTGPWSSRHRLKLSSARTYQRIPLNRSFSQTPSPHRKVAQEVFAQTSYTNAFFVSSFRRLQPLQRTYPHVAIPHVSACQRISVPAWFLTLSLNTYVIWHVSHAANAERLPFPLHKGFQASLSFLICCCQPTVSQLSNHVGIMPKRHSNIQFNHTRNNRDHNMV